MSESSDDMNDEEANDVNNKPDDSLTWSELEEESKTESQESEATFAEDDPAVDEAEESELSETESQESEATSAEDGPAVDEAEESKLSETGSQESEATSAEDDPAGDEAEEPETTTDSDGVPEIQEAASLSLIAENLRSVTGKIDKLENPTDKQLSKSKNLILMLSGITGIVMITSITFFVVMAMSISQKVAELDRVLIAVAKRGIQLGHGIETIVEMENKLVEVIEQNNPIPSSLANIETQLISHGRTLIEKEADTRSVVQDQAESIITRQNSIKKELGAEFDGLERRVNELVNLKPLINEHSELKKQLESLNEAVLNIESKIHDLYVIKQAEMENVYIELTNGD